MKLTMTMETEIDEDKRLTEMKCPIEENKEGFLMTMSEPDSERGSGSDSDDFIRDGRTSIAVLEENGGLKENYQGRKRKICYEYESVDGEIITEGSPLQEKEQPLLTNRKKKKRRIDFNHTHHIGIEKEERNAFTCGVCFKNFRSIKNLELHMETHLGTQKYACDVCNAMFSRKHDLIRHSTRHTGERPYKCKLCDQRYRMPGDLGRHRRNVHGSGNVCDVCGKKYVRKFDLKQHKLRHHGTEMKTSRDSRDDVTNKENMASCQNESLKERIGPVHMCPHCGKSFSTSSNRAKHVQRIHSDVTFTCDTCTKVFKTAYDLGIHIKTVHMNL